MRSVPIRIFLRQNRKNHYPFERCGGKNKARVNADNDRKLKRFSYLTPEGHRRNQSEM